MPSLCFQRDRPLPIESVRWFVASVRALGCPGPLSACHSICIRYPALVLPPCSKRTPYLMVSLRRWCSSRAREALLTEPSPNFSVPAPQLRRDRPQALPGWRPVQACIHVLRTHRRPHGVRVRHPSCSPEVRSLHVGALSSSKSVVTSQGIRGCLRVSTPEARGTSSGGTLMLTSSSPLG